MQEVTAEEDTTSGKPKFFSKNNFKNIAKATQVWKYDGERWGIYHLSSGLTWLQALGVTSFLNYFLTYITGFFKAVWSGVYTFLVALAAVLFS